MAEHQHADIFKCGICLKSLDVPKRLDCFHHFCHSCICQHIKKEIDDERRDHGNQFQCPVCKSVNQIPDKVSPSKYVNDLPTNHVIEELIQREKIRNGNVYCGWCLQEERNQSADIWCEGCKDGLCKDCFNVHKKINALKSHKVLRVEDVGNSSTKLHFEINCQIHKGKITENFCHDHQTTCCTSCITDFHRKCHQVTTIDTASKDQEESTSELMETMNDIIDIAKDFLDCRNRNLREIERERDEVIEKIRSLRTKIIAHLDKLETDFQQRFDKNHNKIKREIEDEIEVCSNHRAIVTNCKQLLSLFVTHSSAENVFTEKQIIEKKIKEAMELVQKLTAEQNMRRYEVDLTPELVNLTECVTSLGTFRNTLGSLVQLTVQPIQNLLRRDYIAAKHYNAQTIVSFNPVKFPVERFHGAKILNDGRILLTNYDSKLLLIFDSKRNLKQEINLPGNPRDLTMISDNEAAVSYLSPNGIAVIDIITGTIRQKDIMKDPDVEVFGITSDGVKLVVVCREKILVMDTSGSRIKDIEIQVSSLPRFISFVSDNRVCYSNLSSKSVHCIDLDGSKVFTYTHKDLRGPCGITCDDEGVIYVAGSDSNNVHLISPSGVFIRILLSQKNNKLEKLCAIHFNCRRKQLLLTQFSGTVEVYAMTSIQK